MRLILQELITYDYIKVLNGDFLGFDGGICRLNGSWIGTPTAGRLQRRRRETVCIHSVDTLSLPASEQGDARQGGCMCRNTGLSGSIYINMTNAMIQRPDCDSSRISYS